MSVEKQKGFLPGWVTDVSSKELVPAGPGNVKPVTGRKNTEEMPCAQFQAQTGHGCKDAKTPSIAAEKDTDSKGTGLMGRSLE